jgi:NADPH-dependent 2,4-dienoyl-CoA reductase/sulfur reductase-like enzyme
MTIRIVVIGADAAGASAASTIKRGLKDQAHVLLLERQQWTSYAACGIPYWVSGDIPDMNSLVARSPEKHRANGLDLRTGVEAIAIDPASRTVTARTLATGEVHQHGYDHLVIATGAVPLRPPIPGLDLPGVHGVQTLDDGLAALESLSTGPARAVVIGAGYIGIEMAEAMCTRGLQTTVVDLADEPMGTLDPDMGALVRAAMEEMGIAYRGGAGVDSVQAGGDGRVAAVVTAEATYPGDIVVLGLGVRPRADLAREAGLPIGARGGIRTDAQQRVEGHEGIWAGGDCVEVLDRVSGQHTHIALGTHANKHGRIIGANIVASVTGKGPQLAFPGVVGTAISRICDLEISRTGLREAQARELGLDVVTAKVEAGTRAHYFPGGGTVHVKVIAERGTGRLLGAQIVGAAGAGKRIDAAATAIWNGMTVEEVTGLDLAYAPPFSPVWDPLQVATRRAASLV